MRILVIFLFPVLLIAQEMDYPDTLTLVNDSVYPCFVQSLGDDYLYFSYRLNKNEKVVYRAIKELKIDSLGIVLNQNDGYLTDLDKINSFVEARYKRRFAEKDTVSKSEIETGEWELIPSNNSSSKEKLWSFGAKFVPYYSGNMYSIINDDYYFYNLTESSKNFTMIESQFSYKLRNKLRLIFNFGMAGNSENSDSERSHLSANDTLHYLTKLTNSYKLYTIYLGLKYSLFGEFSNNVSPYFILGFGKQFAKVTTESKTFSNYSSNPPYINENNDDKFLADINSPYFINFGFGTEYWFNNSLSVLAEFDINYQYVSAKYESRYVEISTDFKPSDLRTQEFKISQIQTRIGIGLNFYF